MKKVIISSKDVLSWIDESSLLYASETYLGRRLTMNAYLNGTFKVTHGDKILFYGKSLWSAVRAFNLAENP
jgi:hypothetical protein